MQAKLQELRQRIAGELKWDDFSLRLYSIDASIMQVMPLAVCLPKHKADVEEIIRFSFAEKIPLTARGAGTGLAGSCIGEGIIIDFSKTR